MVLDCRSRNDDVGTGSDVEGIRVVSEVTSSRVVDRDIGDGEPVGAVDGEALNGIVENIEAGDGGCSREVVGVEELGLGHSSIASLLWTCQYVSIACC